MLTVLISSSPVMFPGNRVLTELVSKMKDMQMDKSELGCLRAIVLFNPGEAWCGAQPSTSTPGLELSWDRDAGPGDCPGWGTGPAPHGLHSHRCLGKS